MDADGPPAQREFNPGELQSRCRYLRRYSIRLLVPLNRSVKPLG